MFSLLLVALLLVVNKARNSVYNQLLHLQSENYDSFDANDKYMMTGYDEDDLDDEDDRLAKEIYIHTYDDLDAKHMYDINHQLQYNMDSDENDRYKHSSHSIFMADADNKKSYYEAQHYCRAHHGTNLATVGSAQKNAKLGQTKQAAWIGLKRSGQAWQSGSKAPFRNFLKGESHKEGCVLMLPNGKWKREPCTKPNFFHCDDRNIPKPGRGGHIDDKGHRLGLSADARYLDNDKVRRCHFREANHALNRDISYIKLKSGHSYKKGNILLILKRDEKNLKNKGCNVAAVKIVKITDDGKAFVRDAAPREYIPSADFEVTSDNNKIRQTLQGKATLPKGIHKKVNVKGPRPKPKRRRQLLSTSEYDDMFDDDQDDMFDTQEFEEEYSSSQNMMNEEELLSDYKDLLNDNEDNTAEEIDMSYEYYDDVDRIHNYEDNVQDQLEYDDELLDDDDEFAYMQFDDDNDEEWRRRRISRTIRRTASRTVRTVTRVVETAQSYARAGARAFRSGLDRFAEETTRVWGRATRAAGRWIARIADNIALGGSMSKRVGIRYQQEETKRYTAQRNKEYEWSIGTLELSCEGSVTITVGVDFDITLTFELSGRWSLISAQIEFIKAVVSLSHHLIFTYNMVFAGEANAKFEFKDIGPSPITVAVGPVPVVFRPFMVPYIGFDIDATLEFDFKVGYNNVLFKAGFEQRGSSFSVIKSSATPQFVKEWSITDGNGNCGLHINLNPYIGAEFLITIYGTFTTGMDIRVNGNAVLSLPIEKSGTTCGHNPLYGGLAMEPNIEIYLIARITEIFGIELPDSAQLDKDFKIITIPITKFTVYFRMPTALSNFFRGICQCRRRVRRRNLLADYWINHS